MAGAPQVIRHPVMSAEARAGLSRAMQGFDEYFAQAVAEGSAQLHQIDNGYVLTRAECLPGHAPELVVCALEGVPINTAGKLLLDSARTQGFATVRVHTARPALGRVLTRQWGLELVESVYLLGVSRGQ